MPCNCKKKVGYTQLKPKDTSKTESKPKVEKKDEK